MQAFASGKVLGEFLAREIIVGEWRSLHIIVKSQQAMSALIPAGTPSIGIHLIAEVIAAASTC